MKKQPVTKFLGTIYLDDFELTEKEWDSFFKKNENFSYIDSCKSVNPFTEEEELVKILSSFSLAAAIIEGEIVGVLQHNGAHVSVLAAESDAIISVAKNVAKELGGRFEIENQYL